MDIKSLMAPILPSRNILNETKIRARSLSVPSCIEEDKRLNVFLRYNMPWAGGCVGRCNGKGGLADISIGSSLKALEGAPQVKGGDDLSFIYTHYQHHVHKMPDSDKSALDLLANGNEAWPIIVKARQQVPIVEKTWGIRAFTGEFREIAKAFDMMEMDAHAKKTANGVHVLFKSADREMDAIKVMFVLTDVYDCKTIESFGKTKGADSILAGMSRNMIYADLYVVASGYMVDGYSICRNSMSTIEWGSPLEKFYGAVDRETKRIYDDVKNLLGGAGTMIGLKVDKTRQAYAGYD